MATKLDVFNLALYKLAQSIGIPSVNDESKAADVMNRLWDTIRDLVLTERVWPWAIRAQSLALDAQPAQPGWLYRYSYPNDCLTAYALTDQGGISAAGKLSRFASGDYVASVWGSGAYDWDTSFGDQSTTINTNVREACLVYACRVEDVMRYPPQFINALACRLAAEAAPPIIGEVGINSKPQLLQEYAVALTSAGAHSMNESAAEADYVTPSLSARGGSIWPGRGY